MLGRLHVSAKPLARSNVQDGRSPYTFKTGRYSSHSVLLSSLPARGNGRRVLDVGGGEGYLSRPLAARGYQIVFLAAPGTAVGPFPEAVTVYEVDLDFQKPPLQGLFDFILCGDVIEHLRDPLALLEWLRGLLASDGRMVASLPNSGYLYFRANVLLGRFPAHDRGLFDRTHLHFLTWNGWRQLFDQAGFALESVKPTPPPIELALGLRNDSLSVRFLERIGYWLSVVWSKLFAYQFVVVARPKGKS